MTKPDPLTPEALASVPEVRKALRELAIAIALRHDCDDPEAVLLAAAPHLERHFRRVLSEELRRDAGEGQTLAATGLRFAADHPEGQ